VIKGQGTKREGESFVERGHRRNFKKWQVPGTMKERGGRGYQGKGMTVGGHPPIQIKNWKKTNEGERKQMTRK